MDLDVFVGRIKGRSSTPKQFSLQDLDTSVRETKKAPMPLPTRPDHEIKALILEVHRRAELRHRDLEEQIKTLNREVALLKAKLSEPVPAPVDSVVMVPVEESHASDSVFASVHPASLGESASPPPPVLEILERQSQALIKVHEEHLEKLRKRGIALHEEVEEGESQLETVRDQLRQAKKDLVSVRDEEQRVGGAVQDVLIKEMQHVSEFEFALQTLGKNKLFCYPMVEDPEFSVRIPLPVSLMRQVTKNNTARSGKNLALLNCVCALTDDVHKHAKIRSKVVRILRQVFTHSEFPHLFHLEPFLEDVHLSCHVVCFSVIAARMKEQHVWKSKTELDKMLEVVRVLVSQTVTSTLGHAISAFEQSVGEVWTDAE